MDQMLLFATSRTEALRLEVAAVAAEQRRKDALKAARADRERRVLYQLDMWGEPVPVTCWVRRRRRKAAGPQRQRAVPADVFAFAALGMQIAVGRGNSDRQIRRIVTREDGVTRHVAIREQDTPEWAEREQARRARQRPPRPPKGAKTRSRKLQDLIGGDDGEE